MLRVDGPLPLKSLSYSQWEVRLHLAGSWQEDQHEPDVVEDVEFSSLM